MEVKKLKLDSDFVEAFEITTDAPFSYDSNDFRIDIKEFNTFNYENPDEDNYNFFSINKDNYTEYLNADIFEKGIFIKSINKGFQLFIASKGINQNNEEVGFYTCKIIVSLTSNHIRSDSLNELKDNTTMPDIFTLGVNLMPRIKTDDLVLYNPESTDPVLPEASARKDFEFTENDGKDTIYLNTPESTGTPLWIIKSSSYNPQSLTADYKFYTSSLSSHLYDPVTEETFELTYSTNDLGLQEIIISAQNDKFIKTSAYVVEYTQDLSAESDNSDKFKSIFSMNYGRIDEEM